MTKRMAHRLVGVIYTLFCMQSDSEVNSSRINNEPIAKRNTLVVPCTA